MKILKFAIGLLAFLCCTNILYGQNVVTGKYKGHIVKMKYYKGSPDDIQYLEYGLVTELNKTVSQLEKEKASLQKELNKLKGKAPVQDDSLQMQLIIQERDLLARERTIDSLTNRVNTLNASLLVIRDSLAKVDVPEHGGRSLSAECPHLGVSYSIGIPLLFNSLLDQKDISGQSVWNRRMTLSHQIGLYWGSRSLVSKGSLSLGVGLEYSRLRFAAGIGQLSDNALAATDSDLCSYTASLSYRNVEESAAMHYLSIPLTLSIGQPYHDRISGYVQFTLVPSFCIASTMRASGYYSLSGHYSQIDGNPVDLTLDEFSPLGFGRDMNLETRTKNAEVNRFLLTGRLAGGIYLPLCRAQQGKTSPWVVKLGVKVDFAITPVSKGLPEDEHLLGATYRLNQYNLLSGKGCRFINPGLEVGIMYIFGIKNK